jgi:hypothetical protein
MRVVPKNSSLELASPLSKPLPRLWEVVATASGEPLFLQQPTHASRYLSHTAQLRLLVIFA